MDSIVLKPIGVVHTAATQDEIRNRARGISSEIEVLQEFEPGLDGIEGFSHIFVLGFFNSLRPEQIGPLKVKPKGLLREGFRLDELPTIGVFALDSPTRPNPLGLSLVRLLARRGNRLAVSGLDYFDGTPVVDIKPYQAAYRADDYSLPDWHARLAARAGHV